MTDQKIKVGDAAIVDGVTYAVAVVEPGGKTVVKMCDKAALGRVAAVAKVRKKHAPGIASIEKAIHKAQKDHQGKGNRNRLRAITIPLRADLDDAHEALETELAAVPRGTTVGANPKDMEWVAAANAWTVRGRLLSYADRQRARGRAV